MSNGFRLFGGRAVPVDVAAPAGHPERDPGCNRSDDRQAEADDAGKLGTQKLAGDGKRDRAEDK